VPRSNPLAPRRHALSRVPPVVWYGLILAGVAWLATQSIAREREIRRGRIADAKAWMIDGPPCPRISKAAFLAPRQKGPKRFDYEEAAFFRRFGHVTCAPIYADGGRGRRFHPVCQFTSPGDLMIRTAKGEWFFRPGAGQPATVSVEEGRARCVMAAKYTIANFNDAPIQ
jgi:hypothetical protein